MPGQKLKARVEAYAGSAEQKSQDQPGAPDDTQ